jgi:putative cell wall-binding protein
MQAKLRRSASAFVAGSASLALAVVMAPGAFAGTSGPLLDNDQNNFGKDVRDSVTYRIAGSDRIATAIDAAQTKEHWGCSVILARYDDFADALVAGPLADVLNAPILVNQQDLLDDRVKQEMKSLQGDCESDETLDVTIVGGTGAISEKIENKLVRIGYDVDRIRGTDRYKTAINVAKETVSESGWKFKNMNVFVTTGVLFPDALAAGTAAAEDNGIVLLSKGTEPTDETTDYIDELRSYVEANYKETPELVTAGGWSEIAYPDADKHFTGSDRYETASMLADEYFQFKVNKFNNVGVASGLTYADAVVGGGFMANADGPLLLTKPGSLNHFTKAYLESQVDWVDNAFVFGGKSTLSPVISQQVDDAIFRQGVVKR